LAPDIRSSQKKQAVCANSKGGPRRIYDDDATDVLGNYSPGGGCADTFAPEAVVYDRGLVFDNNRDFWPDGVIRKRDRPPRSPVHFLSNLRHAQRFSDFAFFKTHYDFFAYNNGGEGAARSEFLNLVHDFPAVFIGQEIDVRKFVLDPAIPEEAFARLTMTARAQTIQFATTHTKLLHAQSS
jgi:hypothetical protein